MPKNPALRTVTQPFGLEVYGDTEIDVTYSFALTDQGLEIVVEYATIHNCKVTLTEDQKAALMLNLIATRFQPSSPSVN